MNVKTQILNIFLETSPSIVIITNAQTLSNSTIRIRGFVTGPSVHMIMIGANILIGRFHYIMDLRALSFPQSSNKTKHIFWVFGIKSQIMPGNLSMLIPLQKELISMRQHTRNSV